MSEILDVDLLVFERSTGDRRRAVVDGVTRSLATGFVYTQHDLSEDLLDTAYGMLREFFALDPDVKQQFVVPGAHGQTGYTGLLVETAASSDKPDWKEMLNWASPIPQGHPLKRKFPTAYPDQVVPESAVPGITKVLYAFHDRDRRSAASLPARDRRGHRLPRDVLRRHGARPRHATRRSAIHR